MSKKMMKRSLALGALMAFVITGSAMAADLTINAGDKGGLSNSGTPFQTAENLVVDGKLTINSNTNSVTMFGYYPETGKERFMTITADSVELNTKNNTVVLVAGDHADANLKFDVAGEMKVSGTGEAHGIAVASKNGSATINANKFIVSASENALYARSQGAKITVNANDVTVESTYSKNDTNASEGHAIYADKIDSSVNIVAANDLKIDVGDAFDTVKKVKYGKSAVKTAQNGYVSLAAKNITVTGTVQGNFDINANGDLTINTKNENGAQNAGLYAQSDLSYLQKNKVAPQSNEVNVKNLIVNSESMAVRAEGANLTVNAENVTLNSNDGGIYVLAYSNTGGVEVLEGAGSVEMNVTNNLTIDAAGNGVSVGSTGPSKNININGNVINITAGGNGVYTRGSNIDAENIIHSNEINISGNNVAITSTNTDEPKESDKGHAVLASGSAINVKASNEVILAAVEDKYAIYANAASEGNQGKVVIGSVDGSAADVIVTGNIVAEDKASISVDFAGSGSKLTGKVTTAAEANTTLNFGDGATWNLNENASTVTNATFAPGSNLVIDGATFDAKSGSTEYALTGSSANATLNVEQGAKLTITEIGETTYNVATNFKNLEDAKDKWDVTDVNPLMQGVLWTSDKGLQVEVFAKNADDMATDTGLSQGTAGLVQNIIQNADKADTPSEKAVVDFLNNVVKNNNTDAAVGAAINSAMKMAEAGGNNATAANIVKNVTGVTNDRLSFNCGHSAPHKGGHGVGLFEEGSGADIWVEYVHGKDKVEDMPSTAGATSYEGQFNGFVMGVDFKKVNKFQSGVAFNYGEGDTNSVGGVARTHSDYDFWGVGYYGNIHNDDSNIIFDVNYAKTDSDVTQSNSGSTFEASPETTTWSAGVKLEKLYQNENVQIVPYTGLRYMSIDSDDYSTSGGEFNYSMDRQDIWLLPLGVSIRQEIANDNGWTVSPRVDLSYIWAFGDTNSNMEVKSPFSGVSQLGYDVMDDGSFLGLVGIEAHKGQWGYGVSYSYQKGDHSESKKWFVDVNYSF